MTRIDPQMTQMSQIRGVPPAAGLTVFTRVPSLNGQYLRNLRNLRIGE